MWANAQRDGRPVEYRWRPLFNAVVWLTPTTRVPCSNAAKTLNPLKLAGVHKTNETISAANGPKFTILGKILLCNNFFYRLSIQASVAKTQPNKVVRWCADGELLATFCVLYLQRAACSTYQTCILNSH